MIGGARGILMRWRWLVTVLLALIVIITEVVEHFSDSLSDFDPDFMPEILIFGVVFPLVFGIILSMLAHTYKSKPAQTTTLLNDNTNDRARQRVFIVENKLVLGAAIESLLTGEANLELIGSAAGSEAELIKEISQSQAEVVILDAVTHLTDPIKLLALLENYPELRVVVVGADDNLVHIYDKQQVLITETTDLAKVIRRGNSPGQIQEHDRSRAGES